MTDRTANIRNKRRIAKRKAKGLETCAVVCHPDDKVEIRRHAQELMNTRKWCSSCGEFMHSVFQRCTRLCARCDNEL